MPALPISLPSTIYEIFPKDIPQETALTHAIRNFPENLACEKAAMDYPLLTEGILQNLSSSNLSIDSDVMMKGDIWHTKRVPGASDTAIAVVALLSEYGGNLENAKKYLPRQSNLQYPQITAYNKFFENISTGREKYLNWISITKKNQYDKFEEESEGYEYIEDPAHPDDQAILRMEQKSYTKTPVTDTESILFEHNYPPSSLFCFPEREKEVRSLLTEACEDFNTRKSLENLAKDQRRTTFVDIDTLANDAPPEISPKGAEFINDQIKRGPHHDFSRRDDGSYDIIYSSSSPKRIDFLREAINATAELYKTYAAENIPNELRSTESKEKNQKNSDTVNQWGTSHPPHPSEYLEFKEDWEKAQENRDPQTVTKEQAEIGLSDARSRWLQAANQAYYDRLSPPGSSDDLSDVPTPPPNPDVEMEGVEGSAEQARPSRETTSDAPSSSASDVEMGGTVPPLRRSTRIKANTEAPKAAALQRLRSRSHETASRQGRSR